MNAAEHQVTRGPGGRILTNAGVWSPDSQWILYDTRSDPAGARFDGRRIEMVHYRSGEIRPLYESRNGAHCAVATFHPSQNRVVFIHGPEQPTPDWTYGATHRRGVMVLTDPPGPPANLDARNLLPPFTPGALRGGSHVHVWHPAGDWVSFTYEDALLSRFTQPGPHHDLNLRNVGVTLTPRPVQVPTTHPRNHDGEGFSVLVTRTTARPRPGSDEIQKAFEEAWLGTNGYLRPDGTRQRRALAFQGQVVAANGNLLSEVFIVDLPDDLTRPGDGPLAGTELRLPSPPLGTRQRRLTFTANRPHPGLQGPRHWLRSSPDGQHIAFLMKDDQGIVQLWTVSPNGGPPAQVTRNAHDIASAFSWSPDGRWIAHVMDHSICLTDTTTGITTPLTPPRPAHTETPRPEACVFCPNGRKIAFVRPLPSPVAPANQIFVVELPR